MNFCLPTNLLNLLHHDNNFLREYIIDKYYDLSIKSIVQRKSIAYLKITKESVVLYLLKDDSIIKEKPLPLELFEDSVFTTTMEGLSSKYILDPLSLYCFDSRFPDSEKMEFVYKNILDDIEEKKKMLFH